MFRYSQTRNQWKSGAAAESSETQNYDKFSGKIFQVDLSKIDGATEAFDGRQWLQQCLKDQQPIGWSMLWCPDRANASGQIPDNSVALMMFATADTVLLLRTHITQRYLPDVVKKVLLQPVCKKICIGYEGGEMLSRKMLMSFNYSPQGIIDLEEVCKRKGVEEKGSRPFPHISASPSARSHALPVQIGCPVS